jgi:hypothetical protein
MSSFRKLKSFKETTNERLVYKKYYFLCEGKNTEYKYLKQIIANKYNIGIRDCIQLIPIPKEGEDKSSSQPEKLIEIADKWKDKNAKNATKEIFDKKVDKIVLVFDLDVIKNKSSHKCLIEKIEGKGYLPAVTNPCFELWLILHKNNSYNITIKPNEKKLLKNEKLTNGHTYTSNRCSDIFKFNPKNRVFFKDICNQLQCAIEQEKSLEQKPKEMFGRIGSNIGSLIDSIIKEK